MVQVTENFSESGPGDEAPASQNDRAAWQAITVEHALYAAIFAAAAAIRFWGLARMPLAAGEALNSLAAWQAAAAAPSPIEATPASALYLHLQTLIFWLGANGDAAARVVSAGAGSLLALVPWLLRDVVGRTAALALAVLFALDPWLVAFSRLADGTMVTTLLAFTFLSLSAVLSLRGSSYKHDGTNDARRFTVLAALTAGLFVTGGPVAWSYLPVLFVFVVLNLTSLRRSVVIDGVVAAWFGGACIAGATGWLTNPDGIGLISASLTAWIDSAVSASSAPMAGLKSAYSGGWSIRTLMADQPFVTVFGLAGLIQLTWRGRTHASSAVHWPQILWFWLAWGVVLNTLPGRSPYSLLILLGPLLIGAAQALGYLLTAAPLGEKGREALAVAGTLLLLLTSTAFWAASFAVSPTLDMLVLQALLLLLLLAAAILLFHGIWSGWREAAWAGAVAFGVALMAVNVGATWRVNHWYELGRPGGLFAESSEMGVRALADDVQALSAQRAGDPHELPVIVDGAALLGGDSAATTGGGEDIGRQAVLGWYLREMRRLQWGDGGAAPGSTRRPLVISRAGAEDFPSAIDGQDYVGTEYEILSIGSSPRANDGATGVDTSSQSTRQRVEQIWSDSVQPWLRWAWYRQGARESAVERVTLWAPRVE